ncbi:MAG: sugar transferase [Eubacteriales bacterium]|nr:sugar transferase [Eubacteriales bacterium]
MVNEEIITAASECLNAEIVNCYGESRRYHIYDMLYRVAALIGVIILSPLFAVTSLIVLVSSGRPVFYAHKRVGQNGRMIKVFKYRTMVMDADKLERHFNPVQLEEFRKEYKLRNDPRVTPIGKFLRKTCIDELPQLFNILKGDMALVGPRPITIEELSKYGIYAGKLLSVKPGLTGLWQVSGRNTISYQERVILDMGYIDCMNPVLDLKIIFKTMLLFFKTKEAC